jgi:transcriptional regulator with XRE-family HTH domain
MSAIVEGGLVSHLAMTADDDRTGPWPHSPKPRGCTKRSPTLDDSAVGRQIRHHRIALHMPLSELSSRVGVSNPQMHRYEHGLTRVAASRLIAIAAALGVSVEALIGNSGSSSTQQPRADYPADVDLLLRAFSKISRSEQRNALIALARSMACSEAKAP